MLHAKHVVEAESASRLICPTEEVALADEMLDAGTLGWKVPAVADVERMRLHRAQHKFADVVVTKANLATTTRLEIPFRCRRAFQWH